ncbi:MAG: MarR family transcriptional regulator [Anaerolineales bacterium]|nr:MarR family transcriptional regulator [Anaerolineales bacterium]
MPPTADECVRDLLDVIPLVMRQIRFEMRRNRGSELNVPQFRTLIFVNRSPGASLGELAEHLGLTPPSTSKLVEGLVSRGLVDRQTSSADRRRITLNITRPGKVLLQAASQPARAHFAGRLTGLSEAERASLVQTLRLLRDIFNA